MLNKYSPSLNTFFLAGFMRRYEQAGTLPSDSIDISDEVFNEYAGEPPEGMMRVAGKDGLPTWAEIIYSS
ncbi:tail fiber assembly protein [Escherichia coli]|uniref:hypothetical protein n=1 Tax=Escherichia coli TaxID=562 RepID=UPI00128F07BB|nr:hypothetical protein [Escherichia coli]EEZ9630596.1 hypothetical protein [Escherichia coli]EKR5565301.1 hypothetical protein [Escherichia coli]MCX0218742.1 tail fiber assembly protein [Escherichia coli]MQJ02913.1 hypothetical protein [Escherichia coli]MQK56135.1 hypothetical protein [Escherichia coli]